MMQGMKLASNRPLSNEETTRTKHFLNNALFSKVICTIRQRVIENIHHIEIDTSMSSIPERSILVIALQDL